MDKPASGSTSTVKTAPPTCKSLGRCHKCQRERKDPSKMFTSDKVCLRGLYDIPPIYSLIRNEFQCPGFTRRKGR